MQDQAPSRWRVRDEELRTPRAEPLFGRETEQRQLTSVLREPGAKVLVMGPGGIGKTALVRAVLPRVARQHADGVWYIPLDPHNQSKRSHAAAVLEQLLAELRPGVPTPTELSALRQHFDLASRSSRALFVFEDLEDPELLELLLPGLGSSAIVTSRRSHDHRLFDHVLKLGGLSAHAATELLDHLHERPEPEQRRIAARTGGVPLALRLASSSLVHGRDSDLILEDLSDDGRVLWSKLGLFSGVFDLEDAVAVSSWAPARVQRVLDELLGHALVDRHSTDRYRHPELQRAQALALLPGLPDLPRAQRAFARRVLIHWLVLPKDPNVHAAEAWLRSQLQDSDLLDEDWAILREAALRYAAEPRSFESLMELAHTVAQTRNDPEVLAAFYRYRASEEDESGLWDEARTWRERELDALLEAGGEMQPAVVRALLALAELSRGQEARQHAERAMQISDELADPELRVRTRLALARFTKGFAESRVFLEHALALAAQGEPSLQRSVYRDLSQLDRDAGDLDGARAWLGRSLALGDDPALHYNLGELSEQAEDFDLALESYRRALRGFEQHRDDESLALTLSRLGQVSIARGDLESAQRWLERGLAIDEELDMAAYSLGLLAKVDRLRGRLREAMDKLIRAHEELRFIETDWVIDEMKACYDAAESESARAEIRDQCERAGLDWHEIVHEE